MSRMNNFDAGYSYDDGTYKKNLLWTSTTWTPDVRMSSKLAGGLVPFTALDCPANGPVMQS